MEKKEKKKKKEKNKIKTKQLKILNNLTRNTFVSIVSRQIIRPKTTHNHSLQRLSKNKQHSERKGKSKVRKREKDL